VNTLLRRSGRPMTRVLKGSQFYLHTPRTSANGMNHTCLCLPSRSWYSFTDPGGMKGWVGQGHMCTNVLILQRRRHTFWRRGVEADLFLYISAHSNAKFIVLFRRTVVRVLWTFPTNSRLRLLYFMGKLHRRSKQITEYKLVGPPVSGFSVYKCPRQLDL